MKLSVGDIFRLMSYANGRCGFGQIVAAYGTSGGHFFFSIFETEYGPEEPSVDEIISDTRRLFALSMDALLFHGYWRVVGHAPLDSNGLSWPEYKLATAPGIYVVEDAFGDTVRDADPRDIALLPFRKVVAPVRLQHAS